MAANKITFYRENTVTINLTFTDIDLTGATVYFTVKTAADTNSTDTTAVIKKDVTSHTDPTAGETQISLLPADTDVTPAKYFYDIKLKTASGQQQTVAVGNCEVKTAYTNRG